jgi:NADH:ubiquinone reductase (H+-translocating)
MLQGQEPPPDNPLLEEIPCDKQHGRIKGNEYLEVPGWPNISAASDCAAIRNPKTGSFHPPTAQHALRQGKILAQNILAAARGGPRKPFTFSTIGQLAAIGRRTGVANILGWNFSGFAAWWMWRTIYLSKLPSLEKRVRVALEWTLDLIFAKDLVQFQQIKGRYMSENENADSVKDAAKLAMHRDMPQNVKQVFGETSTFSCFSGR